jgi:hypothetical protein
MYNDPAALGPIILALITLANSALTVWNNRKIAQVHDAVNGINAAGLKAAELAGYSRGAGTSPPLPPREQQNAP